MRKRQFSHELTDWADSGDRTLGGLIACFPKDAFAIAILLLMAVPALPIPTGGVTHVFEIITMLLALQLIAGRTVIWLPGRWRRKSLMAFVQGKLFTKLIMIIQWFERFSQPRLAGLIEQRYFSSLSGLLILLFALAAFFAPPFSGLDTLPSLGVAIVALSLIFSDILLFLLGAMIGVIGISVLFLLSSAIYQLF